MKDEILRLEHVTLEEGGEILLDNINMFIFKGEIMGLLVSDYKGKKQLIDLLLHNVPISFGSIYFEDKLVNTYEHSSMSVNKVYVIGQSNELIQDLSVADNIFVIRSNFKKHLINRRVLRQQTLRLMERLGVNINPDQSILQLTALERCLVEMVKAEITGCKLIVLCDLRNFLSRAELEKFQEIIRFYKEENYSFLYIGNHHQELFKICDRTALFVKGKISKIFDSEEMDDDHIQPYITSFDMSSSKTKKPGTNAVLSFNDVTTGNMKNITFSVRQGECLVILDINNTILQDIISIMMGELKTYLGKILYQNKNYCVRNSKEFLTHGIAVISENPTARDLFFNMSYLDNLIFMVDLKLKKSRISKKYIKSIILEYEPKVGKAIYETDISRLETIPSYDLVYYRILLYHPQIVFCVNPFAWGDMLCRRHVLELIGELKGNGITVVILSVTISDALDIGDRLLIMQEGKLIREYTEEEFFAFQDQK